MTLTLKPGLDIRNRDMYVIKMEVVPRGIQKLEPKLESEPDSGLESSLIPSDSATFDIPTHKKLNS